MLFEGAVWKKTAVNIKIPIHNRADNPGVHDYLTADLYHRPLISVIQEKLANERHDELFHYQPYELLWNRGQSETPIRVHGELYTSEAFIQAHRELQESPPEPGCDLERVVIALMFWSDSTHLASFGNSKLWPCYMFFGNESKYRRCKPSCRLCSHVAYFNHVRVDALSGSIFTLMHASSSSFQIISKILLRGTSVVKVLVLTSWHIATENFFIRSGLFCSTTNL